MSQDYFAVSIFFIVFRETIEAAIIVCVLLSFVEQLMTSGRLSLSKDGSANSANSNLNALQNGQNGETSVSDDTEQASLDDVARVKRIVKRMRIQIWAGTLTGFLISLCIGAAFIAVFYTTLNDLWGKTEQIWEGVFSLIAAIIIYLMGIAFLKMDHSRVKWRVKLSAAFDDKINAALVQPHQQAAPLKRRWWAFGRRMDTSHEARSARSGKWALFLLPFITVLREGLEAVVFVGGVSMGLPASSIPIAVIVGLIAGGLVGYIIYRTGSSFALHWFLVVSTCILFLIGAGLFSKAVGFFEYYKFAQAVGGDVAETGNGPGSFQTAGNVWHLTYGNPEVGAIGTNGGWQIFNSLFGWNNNATIGTILSYVFYWIAVMFALVFHKWKEGRVTFCGFSSSAHKRMAVNRAEREKVAREQTPTSPSLGDTSESGTRLVADKAPESPLEEKRNNLEGQTPVLTA